MYLLFFKLSSYASFSAHVKNKLIGVFDQLLVHVLHLVLWGNCNWTYNKDPYEQGEVPKNFSWFQTKAYEYLGERGNGAALLELID